MAKVRFRRDREHKPLTKNEKINLIVRLSLFLILLGGGITAIAFGVKECTSIKPGIYTIEGEVDNDVKGYDDGSFKLVFRFDGSGDVGDDYRAVKKIYSTSLKTSYASISKINHYNGYISIYDINNTNYGEEISLTPYLYRSLKDAYNYSLNYSNYSIFNAPIYDYWEYLFTLDKNIVSQNDPVNNSEMKSYLEDLVSIINDESNYGIVFNDEALSVKLVVSDTYLNFINNRFFYRNTRFPLISFNILEDALKVENVANSLKEAGYTKGYISTADGLLTSIGGIDNVNYFYLDYINETSVREVGTVIFPHQSISSSFKRFEVNNRLYSPYYSFSKDDVTYHRSGYINNLTGYPSQYFANSNIYTTSKGIIETVLMNNELILCDSLEKTKEEISKESFNDFYIAFTCFNEEKTIYLSKNLKDFITIRKELDYNLIEL